MLKHVCKISLLYDQYLVSYLKKVIFFLSLTSQIAPSGQFLNRCNSQTACRRGLKFCKYYFFRLYLQSVKK